MTSKCTRMWSFLNLEKAKLWSSLNKVWSWYQWVTTTTLHYILVHGSIEEWCLRGDSLNRETSPVMSSLFLPPLSCLCTRSVHQILFYSIYQQQVLQGCNLELLICWSVVEGLKPKCKMKISVQKLADWLMNFELNINQNLTFSQSSFFQPNPKTRVGVCVKEEDRGYKAADCE